MSLEDEIHGRLVVDAESILQANLDRVERLFQLYDDGAIDLNEDCRQADPDIQILVYFIAQKFSSEANITETDELSTEFFYQRLDRSERTIREYLQGHRESGLTTKTGKSEHRLIAENLPGALDEIEGSIKNDDDSE